MDAARASLRFPSDLNGEDDAGFLMQPVEERHISSEGIEAGVELEFGPARERFGDAAEAVVANAGISVDSAWAFGGPDASALLQWDGKQFWVVAVANLGALGSGDEP